MAYTYYLFKLAGIFAFDLLTFYFKLFFFVQLNSLSMVIQQLIWSIFVNFR